MTVLKLETAVGAWTWKRSPAKQMQIGEWLCPPGDSSTQGSEEWPGRIWRAKRRVALKLRRVWSVVSRTANRLGKTGLRTEHAICPGRGVTTVTTVLVEHWGQMPVEGQERQKEEETGRLEATLSSSAVEESRGMREWLEGNPGTARASETGAITEPLMLVGTAHGTALSAGPPKSLLNCTSFYCKCLKSYERFCRRNSFLWLLLFLFTGSSFIHWTKRQ